MKLEKARNWAARHPDHLIIGAWALSIILLFLPGLVKGDRAPERPGVYSLRNVYRLDAETGADAHLGSPDLLRFPLLLISADQLLLPAILSFHVP
jgi:hypothetical protein